MKRVTHLRNIGGLALGAMVVSIHCAEAELLVYEPFDYPPDEILTGKGGALGTVGTWSSHDTITGDGKTQDWFVHAEGTTSGVGLSGQNPSTEPSGMHRWDGTVANLPTSGGYAGLWGADDWNDDDPNSGEPGRNLDANIELDPSVTAAFQAGTTTWFSYVAVRGWDRNEETPNLIIGTDPTPNDSRAASLTNSGSGIGTGGGPERNNRTHIYPMFFEGGTVYNLHAWLRTSEIDLTTASEATLRYREFRDIEEGFDFGTVAVLDAADDSQLAVIEAAVDGTTADWEEVIQTLPAEALGKIIKIEFRFQSDDLQTFAGWYIDDVVVTIPAP